MTRVGLVFKWYLEVGVFTRRARSPRCNRKWFNDEDDRLIRDLFAQGKTYTEVCQAFNPPAHRGSIKYRVELMALKGMMPAPKRVI